MIFVTGPLFAGKREYIRNALGLAPQAFDAAAVWDVQCLAAERAAREAAGRLACLLAARADTVVRVCCGLPQLLKGEWPC